ncbi:MAG: SRPBCC family protein [Acidobacteriota bacterium]|nr:SRPBCC family protein [Acidobacteriota bacterium]
MQHFEYSSWIDAPVETVFAFHERPDALEKLTPPDQKVEIVSRQGGIRTGARVELRIHVGPWSVTWIAMHVDYETNRRFVDDQIRGPFRKWLHTHRFLEEREGTRLTDSIDYALPGGRIAEMLAGPLIRNKLLKMFRYRHYVTQHECVRAQ